MEGGWLGPLTAAGRMAGGRGGGGGLLLLLPLLVVSWEGASTCGDLTAEWLDKTEDELITAPFCLGDTMRGAGVLSLCGLGERSSFLSSELSPFTLHVFPDDDVSLRLTGCTFRSTATV